MRRILTALILALIGGSWILAADAPDAWPHWRGPEFNGVARGDAPLTSVAANGKLYLSAEDGDVVVLRMGEKFEVLATNTVADQVFIATPAIMDGAIYLRGQNALFSIR
jgi:outer membrane protein assembly factor BamB